MAIARILAKLGLDVTEWQVGLKRAGQQADTFAKSNLMQVKSAIAGAFTVGAIVHFADKVTRAADDTLDLAKATGATTDTLQSLTAAAKATGASQEQMTQAIHKLRDAQGEVSRGNEKMAKSFELLGISADEVKSLSIDTLFERVSMALNDGKGGVGEYSAAIDVLGRGALPQLNDVLTQVADGGLAKFNAEMKEATGYLSKNQLEDLANTRQQLEYAKQVGGNSISRWMGNTIAAIRVMGAQVGAAGVGPGAQDDAAASVFNYGDKDQRVTTASERAANRERMQAEASEAAERKRRQNISSKAMVEAPFEADFQAMVADRRSKGRKLIESLQEMQYSREADEEKKRDQERKDALDRARILRGEGIGGGAPRGDELARIGGFVGGRTDPMRAAAERQIRILEDLRSLGREIAARNAKDVSDN